MHVAIFMNTLMLGGAERVVLSLARALVARVGARVDVVLAAREGPLVAEIPAGARVVELGTASLAAMWGSLARLPWSTARLLPMPFPRSKAPKAVRSLPRLVRYLRQERPDGLLTTLPYNNLAALWAASLARTATRVVVREANTLSKQMGHSSKPFDRRVPVLMGRWYPRASGIVAVSQGVAEDLARTTALVRNQITTIHNPVDIARITDLAAEPVEDAWLQPGQPPVIVAAGRLYPQKDYPTLLHAFALVAAARPARLLILGEGPERAALDVLAQTLGIAGHLRMPGAIANPFAYFRRAGVLALSSAWEGFPNVLLEALACGCPVVSTNCPSGPAEVLAGNSCGRLVPVGDHARLAEAIIATLDAPPDKELVFARARDFALDKALDRYLSLLLGSRG